MPTLRRERELMRAGAQVVAGMDEVGRGALAGPVCVGVVAVRAEARAAPGLLRDSKELPAATRLSLLGPLAGWAHAFAVGWASPLEIDRVGIVGALRLAGNRALDALGTSVDVVLLDGSHDWLSPPPMGELWDDEPERPSPPVRTRVKADRDCSSVAAASIFAKCARDVEVARAAAGHPGYGWEVNKGYGTREHLAAIERLGVSPYHRASWRLPTPARAMASRADGEG